MIWHCCRVPCISSTYVCHITLDQVTLSTGFLRYSRDAPPQHHVPAPVGRSQVSPGHIRHVEHNPSGCVKVFSLLDLSKKKPLKEVSLYLDPKNSKNSAISVTKRPLWGQTSHGGLVFDACNLIFLHNSHVTAAMTETLHLYIHLTPHFQVTADKEMLKVLLWWQEPDNKYATTNFCPFRAWELPTSADRWILLF